MTAKINNPITRYANPGRFMALARWLAPGAGVVAALCLAVGLYVAFFASPPDYQQGETVRIMYVHVPAAWMALFVYVSMAAAALTGIVWRHGLAEIYPRAAAPLGAGFTLICLVTGALWGQPMWGTWWVWDARLTSVLILFFLYLGYIALQGAFDDPRRGQAAGAWLLLAGVVNIPVIKFSVDWWNTLHQPASLTRLAAPAIDPSMLAPLLLMATGFMSLFISLVCLRLQADVYRRRAARAVQQAIEDSGK